MTQEPKCAARQGSQPPKPMSQERPVKTLRDPVEEMLVKALRGIADSWIGSVDDLRRHAQDTLTAVEDLINKSWRSSNCPQLRGDWLSRLRRGWTR